MFLTPLKAFESSVGDEYRKRGRVGDSAEDCRFGVLNISPLSHIFSTHDVPAFAILISLQPKKRSTKVSTRKKRRVRLRLQLQLRLITSPPSVLSMSAGKPR